MFSYRQFPVDTGFVQGVFGWLRHFSQDEHCIIKSTFVREIANMKEKKSSSWYIWDHKKENLMTIFIYYYKWSSMNVGIIKDTDL